MNIRKFIGPTSRDALRLVREAMGADAAVLSNKTLEDGRVEIVAVPADELAEISARRPAGDEAHGGAQAQQQARVRAAGPRPVQTAGAAAAFGAAPALPVASVALGSAAPFAASASAAALPGLSVAAAPASRVAANPNSNPYAAGGLPDVFSSVFGASAGLSADAMTNAAAGSGAHAFPPAAADGAASDGSPIADARPAAGDRFAADDRLITDGRGVADSQSATGEQPAADARFAARGRLAADAPLDHGGQAADASPAATAAAPSEPAPWLVEHAKRLTQQLAKHEKPSSTSARAATPGAAASRESLASAGEPPAWARDIVRNVARRMPDAAGASVPKSQPAGRREPHDTALSVADAVNARLERIVNDTVMQALGSLRERMDEQFAGLAWNERQRRSPVHGALTKRLIAAGFSAQLVRTVVDHLPEGGSHGTLDAATDWAQSVLAANLPVLDSEDALMERGGVFALMGPTGVGKTTTTAKLAARCVMRFGASKVALLTTDSYRIGGHEQLRIFGRILGVPVHAVKDGGDLQLALAELRNKHMVLIDTIGMSQRDRAVSDQIAMLHGADTPVQRLLLLNATSHGDTLNEVVHAYRRASVRPDAAAPDLAGCILTKLDEASNLGGALDTVIRYKLPVHYVSTGQKVPENLYVATKKFLLKSAFCAPRDDSPFVPGDDDLPAMLSALSARAGAEPHEVRFG
ncbi:flagellar biosynthesis protein FlhF [Burkholderia sp. TSV86]|uniref:flagellar biosynthesis protein FlhF n=1 Tax=Burkholderia sp. TSV86 TaxID=1385594 RepID=UPI0007569F06|nr:flagellar biosynthesis protein FlhF [Burkholderia sp. TSV86]KVE35137.1 flagellar biosynthesis protein FlhF [Burkholderia sp. TSV86]